MITDLSVLCSILKDKFDYNCDSSVAALELYNQAKDDLYSYLLKSSHHERLKHLNLTEDIKFSIKVDLYDAIPIYRAGSITKLNF